MKIILFPGIKKIIVLSKNIVLTYIPNLLPEHGKEL